MISLYNMAPMHPKATYEKKGDNKKFQSKCKADGTFKEIPTCKAIKCPDVPSQDNVSVTNKQTNERTNEQTNKHTNKQTSKQTNKHTHTQANTTNRLIRSNTHNIHTIR